MRLSYFTANWISNFCNPGIQSAKMLLSVLFFYRAALAGKMFVEKNKLYMSYHYFLRHDLIK